MEYFIPEIEGNLRKHMVKVPEAIQQVSGIRIFGKLIKSLIFTTDVAIIKNCNANAVIAVYPFTPQPIITHVEPKHEMYLNISNPSISSNVSIVEPKHEMYLN